MQERGGAGKGVSERVVYGGMETNVLCKHA